MTKDFDDENDKILREEILVNLFLINFMMKKNKIYEERF